MRYDKGGDFVDVRGVARLPMRALTVLDAGSTAEAHAFAVSVTPEARFLDGDGNAVDWQKDVLGLTVQQWLWWKGRIWEAARDEQLDPE